LEFAGEEKMKTIRNLIFSSVVLLLLAPMLRAQDLSKYRQFTFGMSLTAVLKHTDQRLADVKVTHARPALIQELEWWPPNLPGSSFQSDTVKQIFLSFYNGELYKISVSYDQSSTEGLTIDDMVKSISQKYGPPTSVAVATDAAKNDHYDLKPTVVASWEDAQYSFNLVRSSYADRLGLVIYAKRVNEQADLAIAEAVKLDQQEGPQREAALQKKQIDDLAAARQKNQRIFRP
jgi:hypothetical protein